MKIVLVHNSYQNPGGEDVIFEQERRLLAGAGNEVIVYKRSNDEIRKLAPLERLTLLKRSIWAADTEREFTQLLTRSSPDLVHVHNTFLMVSPSVYGACHAQRIPVVQTLHNFRLMCASAALYRDGKVCEECVKHGPWRGVYHGCYRNSRAASASVALMVSLHRLWGTWSKLVTRYIALTEFTRNKFIASGLPLDKITVKPNFVDPDPGEGKAVGNYAIFIGRLSPEKGVSTLIQAWARLHSSMQLHILGDGPEKESLQTQARQLGLSRITFRGQLSHQEAIAAVRAARFLVVPSGCYENFPMCIAEAFACGTPVVCSRLGALAELVRDGRTGLHFAAGDHEDLAQKLEWAFGNSDDLAEMGRAARREYEACYTAEKNYLLLMGIYRETLAAYT
jgi:glycosyltransferase involved in cell wall biosynthesis